MEETLAKVDEVEGPGEFPLHDELRWHEPSFQIVKAMIVAHPNRVMASNESGMMALHVFARNLVNPEILALLLEHYPEAVKTPNNFGQLPIHKAASCRHADGEAFKALIQAHPKGLSAKNKDGCTPLHVSVTGVRPNLTVVGTLLREGPKAAKRRCKRGQTPMHKLAASFIPVEDTKDTMRILELLNEAYPDAIRCQDLKGNLPLHLQVQKEEANLEFINALLFLLPDAAICPNASGQTPQDIALLKGPMRQLSIVSALFNFDKVKDTLAKLEGPQDEDSDDEEALLALLEAAGVDTTFHDDAEGKEGTVATTLEEK